MTPDNDRLNLLLDLRRYADAETAAREAIAKNPDWGYGYAQLARALVVQNKREAIKVAREGVRKTPHDAWVYYVLACVLNHFRKFEEAREAIEQSLKLDPNAAWAHRMFAEILSGLGLHAKARAKAIEGLKIDPVHEGLFESKAWAEYACERYSEAIRTATEGLKHHPNSHALRFIIAFIKSYRVRQVIGGFGMRRLHAHREVDAMARECVRLDPSRRIYRDCLRANAVACRAYLFGNVLPLASIAPALFLLFFLPFIGPAQSTISPVARQLGGTAFLASIVSFFVFLGKPVSERCLLAAPLGWLRVPTIPLPPRARRRGQRELCCYVGLVFLPYVLFLAALLV